jgi:hypothetical protein
MKKYKGKTFEANGIWIQNQGKPYETLTFMLVDEKNLAKLLR